MQWQKIMVHHVYKVCLMASITTLNEVQLVLTQSCTKFVQTIHLDKTNHTESF